MHVVMASCHMLYTGLNWWQDWSLNFAESDGWLVGHWPHCLGWSGWVCLLPVGSAVMIMSSCFLSGFCVWALVVFVAPACAIIGHLYFEIVETCMKYGLDTHGDMLWRRSSKTVVLESPVAHHSGFLGTSWSMRFLSKTRLTPSLAQVETGG